MMVIGLTGVQSNLVCYHTSGNKIGRPRKFIASINTDQIGRYEVLLSINHINFNFREK